MCVLGAFLSSPFGARRMCLNLRPPSLGDLFFAPPAIRSISLSRQGRNWSAIAAKHSVLERFWADQTAPMQAFINIKFHGGVIGAKLSIGFPA